ncbi:hypothetical protein LC087_12490 [Bacillus carboniphilus]|uniref:XRE family transcriptional regulator n=1 Tax=Bacillus carboniphilus TaxID=86663 RepID=A0ABY9JQS2_9BACI|nr:hypothetical protein [Bacillus carboniphilus]WLR41682.1 hypothetical protein LC087_12490 [Bacillus carboniphilus]
MKLVDLVKVVQKDAKGYKEIERKTGIKSPTITNFKNFILNKGKGKRPSLETLLKLSSLYFPGHEREIIKDFINGYSDNIKPQTVRELMSFCYEAQYWNLLSRLLEIGEKMDAVTYKFTTLLSYLLNTTFEKKMTYLDLYQESKRIKSTHKQILFIQRYIEMLYYLNEKGSHHKKLIETCEDLLEMVDREGQYLLKIFRIKVINIYSFHLVLQKRFDEARVWLNEIFQGDCSPYYKAAQLIIHLHICLFTVMYRSV